MKYDNNFCDAGDLLENLKRGCEIEFIYKRKKYSITHVESGICIMEFYNEDSEKIYPTAEQCLEHEISGKRLNDIINEMKIIERSF
jgi:hypothetical protein